MREIRTVGKECIDEYMNIYFNSYPAFKTLDQQCRAYYREKTLRDMERNEDVDFIGLFQDGILIATMKIVNFDMNLFGKVQYATGIMALGVHPLYKKQGAALEMVKYFEKFTLDRKGCVAALLPFNMGFYRRMGYGFGTKMDEYHIPTTSLPKVVDTSKLIQLGREHVEEVIECYRAAVGNNHGMIMKFSEELFEMRSDETSLRIGYKEGNKLKGYMTYRIVCSSDVNYTLNRIEVDEMIYENGQVLKSLLGFLRLQSDQAQDVVIRTGEEDFYHILDNPADISGNYMPFGYLQTNISAVGTMYKVLSPQLFIETTEYRRFPLANLTAKFVYDNELSHMKEGIVIEFKKAPTGQYSTWSIGTTKTPDMEINLLKGDFSSLLMGTCHLSSLVRLGAVTTDKPELVDMLDNMMYVYQKPWSNCDF